MKECSQCRQIKDDCEFYVKKTECKSCHSVRMKKYRQDNKETIKQQRADFYLEHRESILLDRKELYQGNADIIKERRRKYYHKNKQKVVDSITAYQKNKFETDPIWKLRRNARSRIASVIKKEKCSCEYLGCSWLELKNHIEKQFQEGMTWENYGLYTWHVDHIVPLANATTKEEMIPLLHFSNLQPMWAKENLRKGARK